MCEQGAALGFDVGDRVLLAGHITALVTDRMLGQKLVKSANKYREPHAMHNAISFYEDVIRNVVTGKFEQEGDFQT